MPFDELHIDFLFHLEEDLSFVLVDLIGVALLFVVARLAVPDPLPQLGVWEVERKNFKQKKKTSRDITELVGYYTSEQYYGSRTTHHTERGNYYIERSHP